MLPALLGTAAGAAAVTAGRGAAAALGNGLSFVAELAKAAGGAAETQDPKSGNSLADALRQRVADLTERIRRQLSAAGIGFSQPVEIVSDELGRLAVAGDHPQKAEIEQAIGNDVLLERDFGRLARDYAEFVPQQGGKGWSDALTISLTESSMGGTTGKLPTGK